MKRRLALFTMVVFLLINAAALVAQEATPEATAETPQSISDILASLPQSRAEDGAFVVGEPTAPITIIEFSDYACPHCQVYRPVIDQVIRDFVATGQAKFELRTFPTAGGQLTYIVAKLQECAVHQQPDVFWQMYDALFSYAENGQYDENVGMTLADDFDLNYSKLLTCAQNAQQVDTDIAFAQASGVRGTPGVLMQIDDADPQFITLDGTTYNAGGVPYDVLAQVIEAANALEATPEATSTSV